MSSPTSCRMSGPKRCMMSGCRTSRSRCSSRATGRTLPAAFRVRLRERPSEEGAGVAHCGRCRGGVGDRRPACAVFHQLDALGHRQRQGFARRRGARSVRRGGAGARAGFGAAAAARRRASSPNPRPPYRIRRRLAATPPRRSRRPTCWHRHRRPAMKSPPPIRARSRARSPCPSRWRAKLPARPPRLCRQSARPAATREAAPARRIDSDELAALLKRAKGLLAIGDITSARLLLERAADAQEPEAALMLAGTYDPQVLGSQDCAASPPIPRRRGSGTRRPPSLVPPMRSGGSASYRTRQIHSRSAQRITCDICLEWHYSP